MKKKSFLGNPASFSKKKNTATENIKNLIYNMLVDKENITFSENREQIKIHK